MITLGYGRVSTADQDPQLQIDALEAAGCDEVLWETGSGAKSDRPVWKSLLSKLSEGDVLIVWKLDRIGRSTQDLLAIASRLESVGAHLRCLTQPIDTTTPHGRLVFTVLAAVAEYERDLIRERTLAGLEAARRRGRVGGRPPALTPERAALAKRLLGEGNSQRNVARQMGVSRSTIQRLVQTGAVREPRTG